MTAGNDLDLHTAVRCVSVIAMTAGVIRNRWTLSALALPSILVVTAACGSAKVDNSAAERSAASIPQAVSLDAAFQAYSALPEIAALTAPSGQSPLQTASVASGEFTFQNSPIRIAIEGSTATSGTSKGGVQVYPGTVDGSTEVVQPLESGARFLTVANSAEGASTAYQVSASSVSLTLRTNDDGSVLIAEGDGRSLGTVMAPGPLTLPVRAFLLSVMLWEKRWWGWNQIGTPGTGSQVNKKK